MKGRTGASGAAAAAGIVLFALVAGRLQVVASGEAGRTGSVRVKFPPQRAVLSSGDLNLVCRGEGLTLRVDGVPHSWEGFSPPLYVSRLALRPGLHELRVGGQAYDVFVSAGEAGEKRPDGPDGWKVYRSHPMGEGTGRCGDCHQTGRAGAAVTVGELKGAAACFQCHTSIDFDLAHSHPLEPIEDCQMCHDLHGSPYPGLLLAPVKTLCRKCHES